MTSKAEVFLSSNSKEFRDCRKILAKEISKKPLLNCIPLEYRGPKSNTALEASLDGVRKSDIIVVMIGEKDSELARKEIEEAILELKYCLVYVKKTKQRDTIMDQFIKTTIEPELTYEGFRTKKELYKKILTHLDEHILNILAVGLDSYTNKRKETKEILKKGRDEVKKGIEAKKSDTIAFFLKDAEDSLTKGDLFTSIIKASTALEVVIQNVLKSYGYDDKETRRPMGWILGRLHNIGLLDRLSANKILIVRSVRNQVIHEGKQITKEQADSAIHFAKEIIEKLSQEKNTVRILKSETRRGSGYYKPEKLFVRIGEKVRWINTDSIGHTVTSGTPDQKMSGIVFDSSLIPSNKIFEFQFNKKGIFRYFDQIHPWIEGRIVVE